MTLMDAPLDHQITHPESGISLAQALQLANDHQCLNQLPPVANIEEAREVVQSMRDRCDFNWLTGNHALTVLEMSVNATKSVSGATSVTRSPLS